MSPEKRIPSKRTRRIGRRVSGGAPDRAEGRYAAGLAARSAGLSLVLCLLLTGCGSSYNVHKFLNEVFEIPDKEAVRLAEKEEQVSELLAALRDDAEIRTPRVQPAGDGSDTVTILLYLNGSNLETEGGAATEDLTEILAAGGSDQVHLLVQTMGTKYWSRRYRIASDHTQIYQAGADGLELVKDDLGQLDCTREETLRDFIEWGAENYPADRYALLLWDHGGGPVYGFGYDQFAGYDAALTLDEICSAVRDSGVYFDWIGMDCCIMSCLEVASALYDYCDYSILSEDFESGLGWYYTDFLAALYENPSISTTELARLAIDGTVSANLEDEYGDETILALIDEAYVPALYRAWTKFAYENETALLASNFSQYISGTGRVHPRLASSDPTALDEMSEYYITDLMAVAENIDSDSAAPLEAALSAAVAYVGKTEGDAYLTGLSVTLPYGDPDFYAEMKPVFTRSGLDGEYIAWLEQFTTASGTNNYFDYSRWAETWSGWTEWLGKLDWYYWGER